MKETVICMTNYIKLSHQHCDIDKKSEKWRVFMNHVRFMFNRIKDYTLLYETIPGTVDLFGTSCMKEKNHIKTYCEKIIDDVSQKLQPMASVNYLGCIGRIANEVYILEIQNGKYNISLTIDTFQKMLQDLQ